MPSARLLAVTAISLAALASPAAAGARAPAAVPRVAATQRLAVLRVAHVAYARPSRSALRLVRVSALRPLTGERTVLPVLSASGGWLRVRLPGRPNGHSGWILGRGTRAATTRWHLVVERAERRVLVYRDGRLVRWYRAIVGKPSTPTPPGRFFVEEAIALRPGDAGAPYALALSARSAVFQEFDGGPGQIALHGLDNVGGRPGTAVSHGCVRLSDAAMSWLVVRIGPGVPVTIGR